MTKTTHRLKIHSYPSNTRNRLVSFDKVYAPTKTPLENKPLYLIYDAAIIDAILKLLPGSYDLYSQIVEQWDNPDCQQVMMQIIESGFTNFNEVPDTEGWKIQETLISEFIEKHCNRPRMLKMGKVEIRAEESPYLVIALVYRTVGEYLKRSFDDMNIYRGEAKGMENWRKHSRKKDKLIKRFKKAGYGLIYGNKIRENARLWVKIRISRYNPLGIWAELNGISKKNLLDKIEPYDVAMGFDRHPG